MPRLSKWRLVQVTAACAVIAVAATGATYSTLVRPVAVDVAVPESDVAIRVFGIGTVEARVLSKVGFELPGRLSELAADAGETVPKGEVLARLDSREQGARLAQARATVSQAEATLAEATANIAEAQAIFGQADQTNRRRQALMRQGSVSSQIAEEAQLAVDIAGAKVNQAKSRVEVARANLGVALATAELDATVLDKHTLRAPYDALVVQRHRELGTAIAAGDPLFTLIDPQTVWTLVHVDESQAGRLKVGQPAEIRLRSLPDRKFAGTVARIDVESDRVTEERRVYITSAAFDTQAFLGEQAEAVITVSQLTRAVLVPEMAIENRKDAAGTVWTVENGRLARRTVKLGQRTLDGRYEISDGVPADAAVLTRIEWGLIEGRAATLATGRRS
jgi:HlyD family secretion protein